MCKTVISTENLWSRNRTILLKYFPMLFNLFIKYTVIHVPLTVEFRWPWPSGAAKLNLTLPTSSPDEKRPPFALPFTLFQNKICTLSHG